MQVFKDRGTLSGYRLGVPESADFPVSHIGEYLLPKSHVLSPHKHETWELLLQLSGRSTWSQGAQQILVNEGELLICPPGMLHGKDRWETADYRILWTGCRMDPELWPRLRGHLPQNRMSTLPEAGEIATYLRILEGELLLNRLCQREGVILAWKELWIAIYRLAASQERYSSRGTGWLVQRVRTLIAGQPGERWTLRAVSRMMGYAPNYFARLFKAESGQSFHQYLMSVRIGAAKEALAIGSESITQIAIKLGFSSSQHFSRVFAERTGVTPTHWVHQAEKPTLRL
jgi:AraC family transcriptional regulator